MTSMTAITAALLALGIMVSEKSYANINGVIVGASGREYRVIVNPATVILHACNHAALGDGFEVGRVTCPTAERLAALVARAV